MHSFLRGCITVSNRYRIVIKGIKVNYDTERSSDFVLPAISFADISIVVPGHPAEFSLKRSEYFRFGVFYQLGLIFKQRRNGADHGSDTPLKFQKHSCLLVL